MLHLSNSTRNAASAAIAAACVSVTALASTSSTVYFEDFAGGGPHGYTFAGATNLWHVTDLSVFCLGSPSGFGLYYGNDATCNYITGALANSGTATSPTIDLTAESGAITLSFDYRIEIESFTSAGCFYDIPQVLVSDDGFATSTLVAGRIQCGAPVDLAIGVGWTSATVDLSAFAGSMIQVRFFFDSVDSLFNGFLGWGVDNILVTAGAQRLSLEGVDCQDDVFPGQPGHQIEVDLWMRSLDGPATGFQAFVEFDDTLLNYRGDLTSYTAAPFTLHIFSPAIAQTGVGKLTFDGSAPFGGGGTAIDSRLVKIIFDVVDECATTEVGWDLGGLFDSELSFQGLPLPTKLEATGDLRLDDTPPMITCNSDVTTYSELNRTLAGNTNCTVAHAGVGCSDVGCTAVVCTADPYCCDTLWDSICAGEAVSFCPPDFGPCGGSIVSFSASATDNCDPMPVVECKVGAFPISSPCHFPVGITTVTCSATDDCDNVTTCSFTVTVTPENKVAINVALSTVDPFVCLPFSRCIHFNTDTCSAAADLTLSFTPQACFPSPGPNYATFVGDIFVPCGTWTKLCVKDRQHTKWATATLVRSGTTYSASAITLLPGDDDNDGDVDINDVTWLVAQFGLPAKPPTCFPVFPADRDADFGNNGFVGIQDYSAMTPQFLTMSSCACALPELGGPAEFVKDRTWLSIDEIDPAIAADVDLNGDGIFDHTDVRIFEMRRRPADDPLVEAARPSQPRATPLGPPPRSVGASSRARPSARRRPDGGPAAARESSLSWAAIDTCCPPRGG
ncbi:MAG: HYR domain-containing protein [Phycisphaerales bacterium]